METAGVYTITSGVEEISIGVRNLAFHPSTVELRPPTLLECQSNSSESLGLDMSDEEEEGTTGDSEMSCKEHQRLACWFCVDCSVFICAKCLKVHHSTHGTVSAAEMKNRVPAVTDVCTKYSLQAESYRKSLLEELGSLDETLTYALDDVDKAYETILSRVAEKKSESVSKVKAVIFSKRKILNERLENNQKVIDGYNDVLSADEGSPVLDSRKLKELPASLVIPKASITAGVLVEELIIPEVKIEVSSSASMMSLETANSLTKLKLTHMNTVGSKGTKKLEFILPGSVCVDRENNVYVADEGNNRIQKISKDGQCIDVFNWSASKSCIAGVAYDPMSNCLLVPRAATEHGILKCSEFSYVTLEGEENARFIVPGMQGGLFACCNKTGTILVSDIIKKSVFVIKDSRVLMEITSDENLKQPAFCAFGKDDEILVVDSVRKVVAVFDHHGNYIRDIGAKDEESSIELKKPCGIAIDQSCGIIAVTDWSGDKIVLYSYQGKVLATAGGFKCPHSVTINDNHRLVVTDSWNNQLKVFAYSETDE
ncbi:protein lin-41-like [Watersipora subatra]|uniref:protein lin-41-like n=1 Tax=Watersipora subatra TaxID=2589382 RepID=UPI00355C3EA1